MLKVFTIRIETTKCWNQVTILCRNVYEYETDICSQRQLQYGTESGIPSFSLWTSESEADER